ncbi:MAG: hypothetical protein R3D85_10160 [Paracoccaceae bacterium]
MISTSTPVDQRLLLEADAADQQRLWLLHMLGIVSKFSATWAASSRVGQHQRARHPRSGMATGQYGDHRQRKLAVCCAGLGDAQHVVAFERRRDGTRLDRGGGFVPGLFDGREHFVVKLQFEILSCVSVNYGHILACKSIVSRVGSVACGCPHL